MNTPVAFIIFNRPDKTKKVFEQIARAKPKKLFVIADGPREDFPADTQKCIATRAILDQVNWRCEVIKNYSDENLGCGKRPATGISWVFENVNKAIILEDDCIPDHTFFPFCEELLVRYAEDERIMQISGNNFQFGRKRTSYSYFFSYHNICAGGWATWARAWKHFDLANNLWPSLKNTSFPLNIVGEPTASNFWKKKFNEAYSAAGNVDFWDYQWTFACWSQNGLSVLPNETLLSNIGFDKDATHTKSSNHITANLPSSEIEFPLNHPPCVVRHAEADSFFIEKLVLPQHRSQYKRARKKYLERIPNDFRRVIKKILSNKQK